MNRVVRSCLELWSSSGNLHKRWGTPQSRYWWWHFPQRSHSVRSSNIKNKYLLLQKTTRRSFPRFLFQFQRCSEFANLSEMQFAIELCQMTSISWFGLEKCTGHPLKLETLQYFLVSLDCFIILRFIALRISPYWMVLCHISFSATSW